MAKVDVQLVAGCIRYYGGWADKIEGKVIETNSDTFNYTRQEPVSSSPYSISVKRAENGLDRCVRSDHPMELPSPHVVVEDRPCNCLR